MKFVWIVALFLAFSLNAAVVEGAELLKPQLLPNGQLIRREPMAVPSELFNEDGTPRPEDAHLAEVAIDEITYISDGLRVEGHIICPKIPGPHPCLIYNRGGNREFGANSPIRVARRLAKFASWGYVVVS